MPISRRLLSVALYILGFADILALAWAVNRTSWPLNAIIIPGLLAGLLVIYWLVTRVDSHVLCPACHADAARKAYDPQGYEFIRCAACGYDQPTGYCQPKD